VRGVDIEEKAKAAAGNHRRAEGLLWSAEPKDGENWALIPAQHRGSDNIDKSNAVIIEREICEQFPDDAHMERFSDWLAGWSENLVLRVYDQEGKITPAFKAYALLAARLENYPLLDESLYSEMEEEDIRSIVENAIKQLPELEMRADLPEDWVYDVRRQLDDYESDIRGNDWWPAKEHLAAALQELGYLVAVSTSEIQA
jgi:hypothetical protein